MASRRHGDVRADLQRTRQRFAVWRRTRTAGERIPEPLWVLAVGLAGVHGLHRTASVLGLDYHSLKRRAESACHPGAQGGVAAFVELSPPSTSPSLPLASPSSAACECQLEFENGLGARMRVHLIGHDAPDLASLCHSFWNAE